MIQAKLMRSQAREGTPAIKLACLKMERLKRPISISHGCISIGFPYGVGSPAQTDAQDAAELPESTEHTAA